MAIRHVQALARPLLVGVCLSIPGVIPAGAQGASFLGFDTASHADLFPPECDGRKSPIPWAEAVYLDGEAVRLDGRLDDLVWSRAPGAAGFLISDPKRGELPSEETVFKVAYDRDALYFAVACLETDPARISSHLSRRDRFSNSDLVSVYIDPYHDKTTGYNFKVNPVGVQMDSYVYNDGEQDQDWDAVWSAETFRDDRGWYVEMRIPFSSIRYRPAPDMTWGLQVYRYMHGRGEDTAWVTWDRDTRGFVSRFGELRGLRQVPAPRQLEILPYFLERAHDPAISEGTDGSDGPDGPDEMDHLQKLGADLKYGVTADLTMNAAIQPDFGQVEADPAELNLSPFETFFQEKRPFFIEGSKFFQTPDFNLFYSRRIGTGDENSRIRLAGKLTGKTTHGTSVGLLAASTDVAAPNQAHNPLKSGSFPSRYFVARIGQEFSEGNHRVNLMGTASLKASARSEFEDPAGDDADLGSREALTGGLDFDLNFKNREYNVEGSVVASSILPEAIPGDSAGVDPKSISGSGGHFELRRLGGTLRGGVFGHWESDRLDLNDLGYLQSPDEVVAGLWLTHRHSPKAKNSLFNNGNLNYNLSQSWLYGGRTGTDVETGDVVWSYDPLHHQRLSTNINGWGQFRSYREAWFGIEVMPHSTLRYETRGGPLMGEPTTFGGWLGGSTDTRKNLVFDTELSHFRDVAQNHVSHLMVGTRWNQSSSINHQLTLNMEFRRDDTQYLETVDLRERPGGQGIGGLSYVFGKIHQNTFGVTLRTNVLFSRNQSLEVYAQPFLTVGDYTNAVELARPDTYSLIPYVEPGYRVQDNDFSYTSVNLNVVYRWEYRPGSTLYLVWTQGREGYQERRDAPVGYDNRPGTDKLFSEEPENTFLIKVSYWLPI